MKNFYDILQVSPLASSEVIDSAWKALIKQCHPDKANNEQEAHEFNARTRQLNEAHDVLANPEMRASYDRSLEFDKAQRAEFERAHRWQPVDPNAYPAAYPGVPHFRFDPQDILHEFVTGADLPNAIEKAFGQACQAVMAKVVKENPIIGEILEHARKQKRKKSA